jgi:hypothetical protein
MTGRDPVATLGVSVSVVTVGPPLAVQLRIASSRLTTKHPIGEFIRALVTGATENNPVDEGEGTRAEQERRRIRWADVLGCTCRRVSAALRRDGGVIRTGGDSLWRIVLAKADAGLITSDYQKPLPDSVGHG